MNMESLILEATEVRKLLAAASGDGTLLYIYLKAGNLAENAAQALNLTAARYNCAMATLRQLGLWQEETGKRVIVGERPVYTEQDVLCADSSDMEFKSLRGEVERLLGRPLNTEELKILLGFIRYLGMPGELISVLICYCKERARQRGSLRNPSLRTIEKEAYAWSEMGIDNLEEVNVLETIAPTSPSGWNFLLPVNTGIVSNAISVLSVPIVPGLVFKKQVVHLKISCALYQLVAVLP